MLTTILVEVLQRGHNMENSPPSERFTADRSDHVPDPVRDSA